MKFSTEIFTQPINVLQDLNREIRLRLSYMPSYTEQEMQRLGQSLEEAKQKVNELSNLFLANFRSLASFRSRITREAEQNKFVKALDGRKIFIRSAHAALNSLLQGAGAIVMKRGLIILDELIKKNNLDAHCVANVHDEWQVEVRQDQAEALGKLGVDAICQAGLYYGLNCPLDVEYKIGENSSETH